MHADSTRCRRSAPALRTAIVFGLPLLLGGCPWFTTFDRQPKIDPWESPSDTVAVRGNPQGSVPITGASVPGYAVSYNPLPGTVDSMSALPNPTEATSASLANGRKYYSINCAVCHGDTGAGDGTTTKFGMPPIPLLTAVTLGRTDGYIYGMIRNGRGLMPTYNRIEDHDRWDVVNYVRALQGRGSGPVETGPLGRPGETGATLPGYTRTAPTRPPPSFRARPMMPAAEAPIEGGVHSPAAPPSPSSDTAARGGRGGQTP